jgi:hypothetical protein
MRIVLLMLTLALTVGLLSWADSRSRIAAREFNSIAWAKPSINADTDSQKVDFHTQIKPILQQRCQPCHFSGGVMYQRLPFDRPETIKTLGTKLFTRLKDEKERELIQQFLAQ